MIHLMPNVLTAVKRVDHVHILIVCPEHIVERLVKGNMRIPTNK